MYQPVTAATCATSDEFKSIGMWGCVNRVNNEQISHFAYEFR